MSMGKSELDRCVDQLCEARERARIAEHFDGVETTAHALIQAVAHLAEYCRTRVADHPALLPVQLHSTIENLLARIEALESTAEALPSWASESPDSPLYGTYARGEPNRRAAPRGPWDCVLEQISADCKKHGWDDTDALITWAMGRAAMLQVRGHEGRFPHD